MPVEYFETEPTKKQPPDLLDRVVDTTEHPNHAVDETNSDYMRNYRMGYEIGRKLMRAALTGFRPVPARRVTLKAETNRIGQQLAALALATSIALAAILIISGAIALTSNPASPAATPTPTPTPTPTVQKAAPHKATRGRLR